MAQAGPPGTPQNASGRTQDRERRIQFMNADDASSGEDADFTVGVTSTEDGKCTTSNQFWVDVQLNATPQRMQVDSGARCSLIPVEVWRAVGKPTMKATRVKVSGLGRNRLNVLATAELTVKYRSDKKILEAFVYEGDDAALLGRDWMDAFGLGVTNVRLATSTCAAPVANGSLDLLLKKFADVFEPTLGKLDGFKA